MKTGKLLYCRDQNRLIDFIEKTKKLYLDFKPVRDQFDRVFLEGIGRTGARYNVTYTDVRIVVQFATDGKRKVVASKGGVIDLEGKRVTTWAQGATQVAIEYNTDTIIIQRVAS